jgi:hypothetical protein
MRSFLPGETLIATFQIIILPESWRDLELLWIVYMSGHGSSGKMINWE